MNSNFILFTLVFLFAIYILYLTLKDLRKGEVNIVSPYARGPVSIKGEPLIAIGALIAQIVISLGIIVVYIVIILEKYWK